ncbi:MAG: SRPBCC family protein [Gemmatimonadaceae bacterium]
MTTTRTVQVTTPSDHEVTITRTFDAPRTLVFKAFTTPELITQWLHGPEGWQMVTCTFDLRVGGKVRYAWQKAGGPSMGLTGTIREVKPPERIVHTEIFDDDWTGGETRVTTTFNEDRGQTTVTINVRYASVEARDGALRTGMTEGMGATYRMLDELLNNLQKS